MQKYYARQIEQTVKKRLKDNPVVAIIGPRQCGKTTLSRAVEKALGNSIHLDLENPADFNRLQDPYAFFNANSKRLICLDEIQRVPEVFAVIRSFVDEMGKNGMFLILGSASPDLLKQSSESLAGRISYIELTPFLLGELSKTVKRENLWLRGGFPRSTLSRDNEISIQWRCDFIRTFLERDIPGFGFRTPAIQLRRFWQMCAHCHGSLLNLSRLGNSLNVSHHTIKSYIDIFEQTFMIRTIHPYFANLKKRLIKSPKLFIRDSGILHSLLDIETINDLFGHPIYGSSWEGFATEQILGSISNWKIFFYRTSDGTEIDLILERGRRRIAIECKASSAPIVSKGFFNCLKELSITKAWIAAPVNDSYPIYAGVTVASPEFIAEKLNQFS
ncbi:MAG: ATP-binding protein [bacterium]